MSEISNIITDKLGRKIKLKEINGKSRICFYRALGARDAGNVGVVMEYWNVMAVDEIDGQPQGSIKSLIDIETLYNQLEKGDAFGLIDEWLTNKAKEKQEMDKGEHEDLKK